MPKKPKKWIQGAIHEKKEGSFTSWCKNQGYKGVTNDCIRKGQASNNSVIRKRASLAKTLRSMSK